MPWDLEQQFGGRINPGDCEKPNAGKLVRFLTSAGYPYASIVSAHRGPTKETVVFELKVERPQRPMAPIAYREMIAAQFSGDALPTVFAVRDEFPAESVHINLGGDNEPPSLCLYDHSWDEVKLRWTPLNFVERIRWWLGQTAKGELHADDQGAEPILFSYGALVIPDDLFSGEWDSAKTLHIHLMGTDTVPKTIVMREGVPPSGEVDAGFTPIFIEARPQPIQRLRLPPQNIGSLGDLLNNWGVDLIGVLRERARSILAENRHHLTRRPLIILRIPLLKPDGAPLGHAELKAFTTVAEFTWTRIGVELGVFMEGLGTVVQSIPEALEKRGTDISTLVLSVHRDFCRAVAAMASGLDQDARSAVVLVGAGAVGSHIINIMRRDGFGTWTIIDNDALLPHNVQRHTLGFRHIGLGKAGAAAAHTNWMVGVEQETSAFCADVMRECAEKNAALEKAELIVDASASIPVARFLSDVTSALAPRVSVFFNPRGSDAVLLGEDKRRLVTLDALEAQYYRAVLDRPILSTHLYSEAAGYHYAGSCRSVSFRMHEHSVTMLSGALAGEIQRHLSGGTPTISVWVGDRDAGLSREPIQVYPTMRHRLDSWEVVLDEGLLEHARQLRAAALPAETGGILLGTIDISRQRICLVKLIAAPSDSFGDRKGFERGVKGLSSVIEDAANRTAAQVEYVGEWHSHPMGVKPSASAIDVRQLVWLAWERTVEGVPAVMMIVGDEDYTINLAIPGSARDQTQ